MQVLDGDSWLNIELIYWFASGKLYIYWHNRCLIVNSRYISIIVIWFIDRKHIGIIN